LQSNVQENGRGRVGVCSCSSVMSCPSRFRMTQTSGFQTEHPQHFHSLSSRSRSLLFPSFISLSHYFPSPAPSTLTPAHSGEREMARARNEPRDAEMPANTRTTTRCLWKKQADAKSLVYYTMGNLMGTFRRNVPIGHRDRDPVGHPCRLRVCVSQANPPSLASSPCCSFACRCSTNFLHNRLCQHFSHSCRSPSVRCAAGLLPSAPAANAGAEPLRPLRSTGSV